MGLRLDATTPVRVGGVVIVVRSPEHVNTKKARPVAKAGLNHSQVDQEVILGNPLGL